MFAPSAHHSGRTKSAPRPRTVNVSQNIFRSTRQQYSVFAYAEIGEGPGMVGTSARICGTFWSKESAMLNWLLRLWRKFSGGVHPRPAPTTYHSSNLHGRHR